MNSIFDILYIPMGFLIRLAYSLTNNYVAAICLFALVMEILLCPIQIKQQKNAIKQAKLAPRIHAIRKKYAGRTDQVTQQKMQQETMDLYQSENFNPAGGCLPLLIQFPVIICLYNVIINPLRYICNVPQTQIDSLISAMTAQGIELNLRNQQVDIINYLREVGVDSYTTIAPALEEAVLPIFQVGPFDLSQIPTISFVPFDWLMLIPIITFIVYVAGQKITMKFSYQSPESQDAQNQMSMKIMTWTMPLLSVYIEFQMAAAIGVYWIFRQIIFVVEKIIIAKLMPTPKFTEEDYKEAERQMGLSGKQKKREAKENGTGGKKKVRSLHHIDDEEYLARHAAEEESAGELTEKAHADDSPIDKAPLKKDDNK
ncbi:MAG: membrane protein insertase YidC [Clostridia bacterium]|nr:membrane protein insertase YidC [Clostridia bacterium]MBQ8641149.1 membrane protein insertase YidC [Clostridia bacterium]